MSRQSQGHAHYGNLCEVCRLPVRLSDAMKVGKKPNGLPRVIHKDKRSCKRTWEDPERRADIMRGWPEQRAKATAATPPATQKLLRTMVAAVGRDETIAAVERVIEQHETPVAGEKGTVMSAVPQVTPSTTTRTRVQTYRRHLYHPDLEPTVRDYFAKHSWRRGAGFSFFEVQRVLRPELLVGVDGEEFTPKVISDFCRGILLRQSVAVAGKDAPQVQLRETGTWTAEQQVEREQAYGAAVAELEQVREQLARAARCVELGRTLCGWTMERVAAGDEDTLKAALGAIK